MLGRGGLVIVSVIAFGVLCLSVFGFLASWWRAPVMTGMIVVAGLVHGYLVLTSKCPSCRKSVFVKEGLPMETAGGKLTMTFLPFPEARCSRCQARLN